MEFLPIKWIIVNGWEFSYWTTEISADKNFVLCIAGKFVALYDAKPNVVYHEKQTKTSS